MGLSNKTKAIIVLTFFVWCLVTVIVLNVIFSGTEWSKSGVFNYLTSWSFFPSGFALFLCATTLINMLHVQNQQEQETADAKAHAHAVEVNFNAEKREWESIVSNQDEQIEKLNAVLRKEQAQATTRNQANKTLSSRLGEVFTLVHVSCEHACNELHHCLSEQDALLSLMIAPQSFRSEEEDSVPSAPPLPPPLLPSQISLDVNERVDDPLQSAIEDSNKTSDELDERCAQFKFDPPLVQIDDGFDGTMRSVRSVQPLSDKEIVEDCAKNKAESKTLEDVQRCLDVLACLIKEQTHRRKSIQSYLEIVIDQNRVLKRGIELRNRKLANIKEERIMTESNLQQQLQQTASSMTLMETRMRRCVSDSEIQVQVLRETVLQKTARVLEMEKRVQEALDEAEKAKSKAIGLQTANSKVRARCAQQGLKILSLQRALREMEKVLTEKETALLSSDDQNRNLAQTVSSQAHDITELRGKTFKMEREAVAQTNAHKELVMTKDALEEQLQAANENMESQVITIQELENRVANLSAALDRASNEKVENESKLRLEMQELSKSLHDEISRCEELQHELGRVNALNEELSKATLSASSRADIDECDGAVESSCSSPSMSSPSASSNGCTEQLSLSDINSLLHRSKRNNDALTSSISSSEKVIPSSLASENRA